MQEQRSRGAGTECKGCKGAPDVQRFCRGGVEQVHVIVQVQRCRSAAGAGAGATQVQRCSQS